MKTIPALNRRDFLKKTARVALAAALPAATSLAAPADRKKLPWKFCAFEKPLLFLNYDETAELFAELGFDGIEAAVRPGGHVLPERVEEDLPKFVEALKKRGLAITVLTSGINSVSQPHTEKVLRTAAKLGIQRYRMDWWRYDLEKPIQTQLDALRPKLKELAALNRSLGVTGLYQNHSGANMVGAAVWDIYSLVREHDAKDVALAFDIRHATVESGLSWPTLFQLVKTHVGVAYFKDFTWDGNKVKNVPLSEGRVDKKYAAMLKESGFAGPISLHVEYGESGKEKKFFADAFRKDFATLRGWLA
ncbi:MAG: sugar phosphate isomerase/epimerase [Pedosphaera sp.]|nr:sugar phosphate isomerase/epimerase [Pedosphaera sp.]